MTTGIHISQRFDQELAELNDSVIAIAQRIALRYGVATAPLRSGNPATTASWPHEDPEIELMQRTVEEACDLILVRRQPAASDMRFVVACIRISNDLGRLHAHINKIAEAIARIGSRDLGILAHHHELNRSTLIAHDMLQAALQAFESGDAGASHRLENMDDEINSASRVIMRHQLTYMMENPQTVASAIETMVIVRSVERIGDYAKDIANLVKYMRLGRDPNEPQT
ncbi:MAG: phosphate signaling complex protein PhoU [Sideroxyarcus sp.]|nr:phosphate signaling complex protein PhoU [Sideroxyarcus sp.]